MATNVQGPTPENAEWRAVLDEQGFAYRQRRLSGALISLCLFHDEKTPSMYMWPNGNLYCHGCGVTLTLDEFLPRLGDWRAVEAEYDAQLEQLSNEPPI